MKKHICIVLILTVIVSHAQHSFFRGSNNYARPIAPFLAPTITTNGLILNLDAANPASYTGSGSTWTNLATGGNSLVPNFTINSLATYNSVIGAINVNSGSNSIYGVASTSNSFGLLSSFTIEMWVKVSSPPTSGGALFVEKIISNPVNMALIYNWNGSDFGTNLYQFNAGFHYSGWKIISTPNSISMNEVAGQWVHILSTFDGLTKTVNIYKNGVNIASGIVSASVTSSSNGGYFVGQSWGASGGVQFGDYSIVNIYNRALLSSEVSTNYNAVKSRFGL